MKNKVEMNDDMLVLVNGGGDCGGSEEGWGESSGPWWSCLMPYLFDYIYNYERHKDKPVNQAL